MRTLNALFLLLSLHPEAERLRLHRTSVRADTRAAAAALTDGGGPPRPPHWSEGAALLARARPVQLDVALAEDRVARLEQRSALLQQREIRRRATLLPTLHVLLARAHLHVARDDPLGVGPPKANYWQGHFPYLNSKKDGYEMTSPVGSYRSNGYGLFDMSGNVWEWCSDFYNVDGYLINRSKGICLNPEGPENSYDPNEPNIQKKIIRGGSFLCNDTYCSGYRVTRRMGASKDTGLSHTGFRCVKDL